MTDDAFEVHPIDLYHIINFLGYGIQYLISSKLCNTSPPTRHKRMMEVVLVLLLGNIIYCNKISLV